MWLCVAATTTIASAQSLSPAKTKIMKQLDLWTLVDYLPTRTPFDKDKIEKALRIVLVQDEELATGSFDAFKGGPVLLADEAQVESASLRVSRTEPVDKWILNLSITGRCVARSAVLARVPRLQITGAPRGRSLDEQTYWSSKEAWGSISFGFAERHPDCLSSVLFTGPKW
ncbi:hypothetical protein CDN99_24575 [Roseateles aquatilis]|uniref:Uncharacterized protein n=2 Tax=Roseateles aquatilis TaxID=431061 RepID=A0A246IW62_9BURK|nr:hypothetical protein CDN99_24575 [Roseateles aquatilis]